MGSGASEFDSLLAGADVLVLVEGSFDGTSLEGKLTGEAMVRAVDRNLKVVLLAPTCDQVPPGVVVESGGGVWDTKDLANRAERALRHAVQLPGMDK